MKNILSIAAFLIAANPAIAGSIHNQGLGSGFEDFGATKPKSGMPELVDLDSEAEDDYDVTIKEEDLSTEEKIKKKAEEDKREASDIAIVGDKKDPLSAADGALAGSKAALQKGEDLTKGEGRDPGYKTGSVDSDNKDQQVNFIQNGTSSWGLSATIICDQQENVCRITPDGGPTVESTLPADQGLVLQAAGKTYHHRYRNVSFGDALGGDPGDVIGLAWGRSLGELGINASNVDYYYGSTAQTRDDLSNMNFGATVAGVLFKPIPGEPNRYIIIGGGGGGGGGANDSNGAMRQINGAS